MSHLLILENRATQKTHHTELHFKSKIVHVLNELLVH
jgi:hypothetical protein